LSLIQSNLQGEVLNNSVQVRECSDCGGTDLIQDPETGEIVCTNCGTVQTTTVIDHGPEWRAFNIDEHQKLTRVGSPLTLTIHDKGLSTTIGWQTQDASGRKMTSDEQDRLKRLRIWQRRTTVKDGTQRNLSLALSEMKRISYQLNLPTNLQETAAMIYRQAIKKQLIRGRTIQSIVAATIYMACRQCGLHRSLEDISKTANLTKKDVARNYRFLHRELNSEIPQVDRSNLITKFVNNLNLPGSIERIARDILTQATKLQLTTGRAPEGITAACIYLACKLSDVYMTQGNVAKTAQITEVTIRNRYKELVKNLDLTIKL
jgi:transcription initiation factor TFIIB